MEQKTNAALWGFKDKESGKWGFKNSNGDVVVSPRWWLVYHRFDEGMCAVVNDDKEIGFVDETGKVVIPCQYVSHSYFSEGLVKVQQVETFKIGYINRKGETVIPFIYRRGGDFKNGIATVCNEDGMWGCINQKGEIVIPFTFYSQLHFYDGMACVVGTNDLWGFADEKGNLAVPYQWKSVALFFYGLAGVEDSNELWGFIDKKGNLVIPCQWAVAEGFDGYGETANVRDAQGNWYKIDRKGHVLYQLDCYPEKKNYTAITLRVGDEDLTLKVEEEDVVYYQKAAHLVTKKFDEYVNSMGTRKSAHTISLITMLDLVFKQIRYKK